MKISVIQSSYNHSKWITRSIESIWSQNYRDMEIIVVDDASTDDSAAVIENLRRNSPVSFQAVIKTKNLGAVNSLQEGFKRATGDVFITIASDDFFLPNAFVEMAQRFQANPDLALLCANGRVFSSSNEQFRHRVHTQRTIELLACPPEEILRYLYTHSSPFFLQCVMVKPDVFKNAINQVPTGLLADDWAINIFLFSQLTKTSQFEYMDKDVFAYRVHGNNVHTNMDRLMQLKRQMVEQLTPESLKKEARANIEWEIGRSLLKRKPLQGAQVLLNSLLLRML